MPDTEKVEWLLENREELGIKIPDGYDVDMSDIDKYAKWAKWVGPVSCESKCELLPGELELPAFLSGKTIKLFKNALTSDVSVTSEFFVTPDSPNSFQTTYLGDLTSMENLVFIMGHEAAHTRGIDLIPGPYQHPNANYHGIKALRKFRELYKR